MKSAMKIGSAALIVSLAGLGAHASAEAGEGRNGVRSVRVSLGDLDLTRRADGEILLARIKAAARQACRGAGDGHVATGWTDYHCRREAVKDAVVRLDAPVVTALLSGERAPVQYASR